MTSNIHEGEQTPKFSENEVVYIIPDQIEGKIEKFIDATSTSPKYPFKYECYYERGSKGHTKVYEEHELEKLK